MCACACVQMHVYVCMYVCACMHVRVCVCVCVCVCAYAHMHVVQRTFRIVFLGSLKNVFGRDYNDSINSIWQYVHFNSIDSSNL